MSYMNTKLRFQVGQGAPNFSGAPGPMWSYSGTAWGDSPMGGATGGCGGGDNVPLFWDQRGTGGTGGGPMKMIFASMFINATTRQQISLYSIGPY